MQTPTEATRLVGTPGNPSFGSGWGNFSPDDINAPAGFYKDQFGVVHLQGVLDSPNSASRIFTLPPGYRPEQLSAFPPGGDARAVGVETDGDVFATEAFPDELRLDGITFRAAP